MNIGERIKQRRKELNLSVDDVANRLNKNRATIYRYESNDIENLPITILEPLAQILQTTPIYLLGLEDKQKNPQFNESNIEIGKRLFNARKAKDLTRAELGKLLGLHETTVKRYEDGEIKSLSIEKLKEFAKALGVKPTYLIGWDDENDIKNEVLTSEESALINKYRTLDSKGKHTVKTVLNMEYVRCNNVLMAAHEKEDIDKNSPTYEEDNQHDINIMLDDDEWK